jgi:hypothetical protein
VLRLAATPQRFIAADDFQGKPIADAMRRVFGEYRPSNEV